MNIEEQFNLIADEYDANRKRFIPCFDDYYITSTKMILANIETPHSVLDLGAGTGLLPAGGLFANYDQFCADTSEMSKWMDSYWKLQLYNSGLTNRDIELWKERRKLDKEYSVETEMTMLRACQFTDVQCIYSYHKFSVIVAKK